jgi:RimJ/RimL family protein N-acetyltransferase
MIHPDNEPSRRVAQKLGMAPERTVVHAGEPAVVYATAERGRLPASFGHLNAR